MELFTFRENVHSGGRRERGRKERMERERERERDQCPSLSTEKLFQKKKKDATSERV